MESKKKLTTTTKKNPTKKQANKTQQNKLIEQIGGFQRHEVGWAIWVKGVKRYKHPSTKYISLGEGNVHCGNYS